MGRIPAAGEEKPLNGSLELVGAGGGTALAGLDGSGGLLGDGTAVLTEGAGGGTFDGPYASIDGGGAFTGGGTTLGGIAAGCLDMSREGRTGGALTGGGSDFGGDIDGGGAFACGSTSSW